MTKREPALVTDEMRTATISVCIACIDARTALDKIIDKHVK